MRGSYYKHVVNASFPQKLTIRDCQLNRSQWFEADAEVQKASRPVHNKQVYSVVIQTELTISWC